MFYVYLLRSEAAKKIYVGLTNDLQRRLEQHNAGENISTKPYRPWKLIYHEASMTYQLAESREHRLKYHGNALRELKIRLGLLEKKTHIQTKKKKKSGAGFTLVEILLATALFSMTMLIGTSVFILAHRTQRIITASQKLQDDTRYIMEAISRDIKFTTVDYGCYNQSTQTCYPADFTGTGDANISLQTSHGQANVLALKHSSGVQTFYAVFVPEGSSDGQKKLLYCSRDPASELPDKCFADESHWTSETTPWKVVTPAGVQASRITFWISPFVDPYRQCPEEDCGTSPYLADAQPRVTIVLQTRPSTPVSISQTSTVQTTTVSRLYYR